MVLVGAVAAVTSDDGNPTVGPLESTTPTAPATTTDTTSLRFQVVDVEWTVVAINGIDTTMARPASFTLQSNGRLVGFDGCNRYGFDLSLPGGWTVAGDTLRLDQPIVSTAVACSDAQSPIIPVADGTRLTVEPTGALTLTSPDGTVYRATVESDATAPTTPQRFVAIGESVMAGAATQLKAAGAFADIKEGRGPEGVKNAVITLRDTGVIGIGTTIVIQVGTNAPLSQSELDAILAEVPAGAARVAFMTVHADIGYISANNALIRALPEQHSNVTVIDWDARSAEVELCADGIHISCNGPEAAAFFTNLILEAIGLPAIK